MPVIKLRLRLFAALLVILAAASVQRPASAQASDASNASSSSSTPGGPIRLRQPQSTVPPEALRRGQGGVQRDDDAADPSRRSRPVVGSETFIDEPRLGEFEIYVQKITNDKSIRRFGAELVLDRPADSDAQEFNPVVPDDYVVSQGDEVVVNIWGSVDADLRLQVDRSGRINIPRIGSVMVAGTRYAELTATIDRQARRVFRNYELSATLGQLRGVRVFVTGFAARPGAYSVSSLATVSSVLFNKAGGPAAAGSFRHIELRRAGRAVARLDLYDLLLTGKRDGDQLVQADDVIHVGPVARQVALIGSVNKAAIYEQASGETVGDLLRIAGGFNSVADRTRLAVERLTERNDVRVRQVSLPAEASIQLDAGDVVRAFSAIDAAQPVQRQNKRVRIEGEVLRPGDYVLPPESSIADALKSVGGLTDKAYPFGTEFSRTSVRITQQQNYDRALRDLETDLARNVSTQRTSNADDVASQSARDSANARLLASLRLLRPSGRIVLQLRPDSRELPPLELEDGDRLYVPPLPSSVGVFGSVFNAGSYLYGEGRGVEDYLNLAGGPTRGADAGSTFVIRANGSVVSGRQSTSWFSRGTGLAGVKAEAGDTVFVPEELNKTTFVQSAKDWTQILYQLGIGLAAIKTIGK